MKEMRSSIKSGTYFLVNYSISWPDKTQGAYGGCGMCMKISFIATIVIKDIFM